MRGRRLLPIAVAIILLPASRAACAVGGTLPAVAVEETLEGPSICDAASGPSLGVAVRIAVVRDAPSGSSPDGPLERRLKACADKQVPVWLALDVPAAPADAAAWRTEVRRLVSTSHPALAVLEVRGGTAPWPVVRYALEVVATEARAAGLAVPIALGIDGWKAGTVPPEDATSVAPYATIVSAASDADAVPVLSWLRRTAPDATAIVRGALLPNSPDDAATACARSAIWSIGSGVTSHAWRGKSESVLACAGAAARLTSLVPADATPLDDAASALKMLSQGQEVTSRVPHRLLLDQGRSSTLLAYEAPVSDAPIEIHLMLATAATVTAVDAQSGSAVHVGSVTTDSARREMTLSLPQTGRLTLVTLTADASGTFQERTSVVGRRALTVDEIIARHRQRQATEDRALENVTADMRLEQHFRPSMTDPGYDVVTDNRYFADRSTVEWEERSFSVNGSKWGADRPPFPLIQPEKVLSLPLQLRFGSDYGYRLAGTERVGDRDCYVVAFEPVRQDVALYRGTVWIDRSTFARVRVRSVQLHLSVPIVSNEETQAFDEFTTAGGAHVTLLSRLTAHQIVMIAGRNVLLDKIVTFAGIVLNAPTFEAKRTEARRGDLIMYRDTDAGVRYLVKQGDTRIVSLVPTLHAKARAYGLLLDPSYSFPLPIFGINYLDFQFKRPDTQLAILFGGVLLAGNIQRAKIGGSPFDASVDFFGIAAPSSDRLYTGGQELEGERVLTWPMTTGVAIGWQYTPFQKISVRYDFRFDAYVPDRTTVESFRTPSNTITNGWGGAWELKQAGYNLQLAGSWYVRAHWADWGLGGSEHTPSTYSKYSASLSRDFYLDAIQKIHLNAAYFGGDRLDRFNRYQFGLFDDTRIHGVPASGIRLDELQVVRGSYSFNLFDQYRIDLFLDQGWGRDRERSTAWNPITGTGVALNLRGPRNTIVRADVGKSFLPSAYRGVGSVTAQLMILKPLK